MSLLPVVGFLSRKLPENFNESWYMFLSVSATLLIWTAFLPTYFMMFYAYYKATVLSLALSLNALCNLSLLFMPKVYAIYWLSDKDISSSFEFKGFKDSRIVRGGGAAKHKRNGASEREPTNLSVTENSDLSESKENKTGVLNIGYNTGLSDTTNI